jgi:chromatin segregation and condensation protein Rec8/ScpA/Scc1 (kleisin family)
MVELARQKKIDPNKIVSIEVTDPIRNGRFSIDLLESATDNQVTAAVRAAWKRFVRSHPVTRGARL